MAAVDAQLMHMADLALDELENTSSLLRNVQEFSLENDRFREEVHSHREIDQHIKGVEQVREIIKGLQTRLRELTAQVRAMEVL